MISPITSGMAASCSQPCAQVSITLGVSLSRSTIGAARPAATARVMSLAFSACSGSILARSNSASRRSATFFVAVDGAVVTRRAALLAGNLSFAITNFLFVVGYGLGLAIGAYLYTQGSVSIGTAFLIVFPVSE